MGTGDLWETKGACSCMLLIAITAAASPGCGSELPPSCPESSDAEPDSGDDGPGTIVIIGTLTDSSCPEIAPIGVSPDSGGLIVLSATVSGPPPDGSVLSYSWSAPTGSFTAPDALDTSYRCPGAGPISVTLTASAGACRNQTIAVAMCQMVYMGQ